MIERVYVGSHVTSSCYTCGIEDYFMGYKLHIQKNINSFRNLHRGHEGKIDIENEFALSDPDYISPYACSGCELCEIV